MHPELTRGANGSALLTALFIMTMVAIAVTAMSARLQLDIYRLRLTATSDRLYLASQAVTFWSMDKLSRDKVILKAIDQQGKVLIFPKRYQSIYPEVKITGALFDLQARLNINNLQDKSYRILLLRLLERLAPDLSPNERQTVVQGVARWVSSQDLARGQDSFLNYYLQQKPPYYPAFQPMASISELRLLQGIDEKSYQILMPYLTALPEVTPININTAPKPILMLLGNGLKESQALELLKNREEKSLSKPGSIFPLLQKFKIPHHQVTAESTYFLSVATVSSDNLKLTNYTILQRVKSNKGKISVNILYESLNTL